MWKLEILYNPLSEYREIISLCTLCNLIWRTNHEGALLRYSCRRVSYYSEGATNRGGRSNRGSTVYVILIIISAKFQRY